MIVNINELNQMQDVFSGCKESIAVALCMIDDGVIITDVEDRVVLINGVAEILTGWNAEEAIGRSLDEILHIINDNTDHTGHIKLMSRNGREREISDKTSPVYDGYGNIIGFVLILCDTSKKQRVRPELLGAQEPDNFDLVAVDIVHKFNNILTVILGNVSLAKKHAQQSDKIYEKLTEVENASKQARILMQRLQTFYIGNLGKKAVGALD